MTDNIDPRMPLSVSELGIGLSAIAHLRHEGMETVGDLIMRFDQELQRLPFKVPMPPIQTKDATSGTVPEANSTLRHPGMNGITSWRPNPRQRAPSIQLTP
jgi:hypothetical protein